MHDHVRYLITFLNKREKHKTQTEYLISLMQKLSWAYTVNSAVVYIIIVTPQAPNSYVFPVIYHLCKPP